MVLVLLVFSLSLSCGRYSIVLHLVPVPGMYVLQRMSGKKLRMSGKEARRFRCYRKSLRDQES
jgi:hypothetical protein